MNLYSTLEFLTSHRRFLQNVLQLVPYYSLFTLEFSTEKGGVSDPRVLIKIYKAMSFLFKFSVFTWENK